MVRKFLYFVTFLILVAIAGAFALRLYSEKLTEIATVPSTEFVEPDPLADSAYQDPKMWFSRPGMGGKNDPALWQPQVRADSALPAPAEAPTAAAPRFAVFFVHPTSYINRTAWNAPLDDAESQNNARIFVQGLASPFNQASEVWAPRYRQATFGAFLTDRPEAGRALDLAYRDVDHAFSFFLDSIDADMPVVLVGHSQGALHVIRLLNERIKGTPLQDRIAMAYPVGWPISVEHDLPALGLPACATPQQGGCIVSWSSFAEPADPSALLDTYANSTGLNGQKHGDSTILCVNPVNGMINGAADAALNLGTLVPDKTLGDGALVPGAVPARCDARGLLLIGDPPELGPYVLPGNNYHVYDIPLFWKNLQEDVARRVAVWTQNRS